MQNVQSRDIRIVSNHPQAQGARAHQLAMYVVYEAPLQMLSGGGYVAVLTPTR
ncbi:MAG: hypothetical protein M3Z05_14395 [Gemmatimonadota bacterium]|nr:hypothetical protein [Gemmatimonadota bacterium]